MIQCKYINKWMECEEDMSIRLTMPTEEQMEEMAEEFIKVMEGLKKEEELVDKEAREMSGKELNLHIEKILETNNGSFWEYEEDYHLEQVVAAKMRMILRGILNYDEEINKQDYLDFDLITKEQSLEYMFADSVLLPFTLNDKYYVAYDVYGQGEGFFNIDEVNKEESEYILDYADINYIKNE